MSSAFRLPAIPFTVNRTPSICCKSDPARIPSRPYKLFSAMRRRVIWMPTIVPVSSRGGGSRARFACGRRGCRGRPGADLRAACGEVPARTRGTRSYDGVRVACMPNRGRSLARWRVSNVSAHADPIIPDSDGRASRRGGAWPAVSGASVSARFPSLSGRCSGRCVAT